jgi:hypothetical protein
MVATPTPAVGEPLPRATEAYTTFAKLDWMLAAHGHGPEWGRVFRIAPDDAQRLWRTLAQAIVGAPISSIRDAGRYGVSCEVRVTLTFKSRTAIVLTAWHYEQPGEPPRLVTAFPTP